MFPVSILRPWCPSWTKKLANRTPKGLGSSPQSTIQIDAEYHLAHTYNWMTRSIIFSIWRNQLTPYHGAYLCISDYLMQGWILLQLQTWFNLVLHYAVVYHECKFIPLYAVATTWNIFISCSGVKYVSVYETLYRIWLVYFFSLNAIIVFYPLCMFDCARATHCWIVQSLSGCKRAYACKVKRLIWIFWKWYNF